MIGAHANIIQLATILIVIECHKKGLRDSFPVAPSFLSTCEYG
jgi:hypothetical protein